MRLLHARPDHVGDCLYSGRPYRFGGRGPGVYERQSVSLRRLCGDHESDPVGGGRESSAMNYFDYISTSSAAQAMAAFASTPGHPRFLAGGTTLLDLMKLNVERPDRLIDITAISELASYEVSGETELVFGSLARMSD